MLISTTLLIGLLFLIPSLILFVFPYKDTIYFDNDNDTPTIRFFGILFASILLMFFIIVTGIRLSCDHCKAQMSDLSSLVRFKSQSTANVSDTYSKISSED